MDMKRSLMVLAAVFAMASTSALAGDVVESKTATLASKAVEMTDEQLDEITGAGAITMNLILNAGNADVLKGDIFDPTHITCVNCSELGYGSLDSGPAQGAHFVANRGLAKHGYPEGRLRCFGGFTLGMPGC